jgi:hypothetical protein
MWNSQTTTNHPALGHLYVHARFSSNVEYFIVLHSTSTDINGFRMIPYDSVSFNSEKLGVIFHLFLFFLFLISFKIVSKTRVLSWEVTLEVLMGFRNSFWGCFGLQLQPWWAQNIHLTRCPEGREWLSWTACLGWMWLALPWCHWRRLLP